MREQVFTTLARTTLSREQMFEHGNYTARRIMERELKGQDVQGWLVELDEDDTADPLTRKINITFDIEDHDGDRSREAEDAARDSRRRGERVS